MPHIFDSINKDSWLSLEMCQESWAGRAASSAKLLPSQVDTPISPVDSSCTTFKSYISNVQTVFWKPHTPGQWPGTHTCLQRDKAKSCWNLCQLQVLLRRLQNGRAFFGICKMWDEVLIAELSCRNRQGRPYNLYWKLDLNEAAWFYEIVDLCLVHAAIHESSLPGRNHVIWKMLCKWPENNISTWLQCKDQSRGFY